MQPEVVVNMHALTGEGPLWDQRRGVLFWVDIPSKLVMRYDPASGRNDCIEMHCMVGTIALREGGGLAAALEDGIYFVDFDTQEVTPFARAPQKPGTRFNDGKCDPRGDFWAGTMSLRGERAAGDLFRFFADGRGCEKMIADVSVSNGLAWNEQTFYYTDTATREIWAYDYAPDSGSIGNRRTVVRIADGEGGPDGFTIDTRGMLWVAQWGGGRVCQYNPENGEKLQEIMLPASRVSCCAFGGEDMDELYITTACDPQDAKMMQKEPLAGSLFRVKVDATGLPSWRFNA